MSYRAIALVNQLADVRTAPLFKADASARSSPIDQFLANANILNRIYFSTVRNEPELITQAGNLVLLGYMSAIESYFRAIFTGVINIDEISREKVGSKSVSFALASSDRDKALLPEALMENMAFSTAGNIEKALNELIGIGKISEDVSAALRQFKKLCEVRHCCVHRFGKLGSQNALNLGFETHRDVIEHPFSPATGDFIQILDALQTTVKTFNNFLFREIIDRTAARSFDGSLAWRWHWAYAKDREKFAAYFELFAIRRTNPKTARITEVYASFKNQYAKRVAAESAKRGR